MSISTARRLVLLVGLPVAMAMAAALSAATGSPATQAPPAAATPGFEQLRKIDIHSHIYEDLPVVTAMLRRINLRVINISVPATDGHMAFMHRFNAGLVKQHPDLFSWASTFDVAARNEPDYGARVGKALDETFATRRGHGQDLEGGRARAEAAGRIVRVAGRSDLRSRLRPPRAAAQAAAGASRRAARGVAAPRPEGRPLRLLLAQPEVAPLQPARIPEPRAADGVARPHPGEASHASPSSARTSAAWSGTSTKSPSASTSTRTSTSRCRRGPAT